MTLHARVRARRGPCQLDLDLTIEAGETLALVGPNAAGKSTLVDVLCGLWPLDDGEVVHRGRVLERPRERIRLPAAAREIGLVPQGLALFPHLDALDNAAYGLRARGVAPIEARRRAHEWLARLGVDAAAHQRPATLSGGQAQRVALARALAFDPPLVILDEPLAAIDVPARRATRGLLRGLLRDRPGARLLITHDPRDALALADRLAVLEGGRITRHGPLEECLADPRSPFLAALLAEHGLPVPTDIS